MKQAFNFNAGPCVLPKEAVESTFKSSGKAFTYTVGQYLYMYGTSSTLKVQSNILNQWTNVDYTAMGKIKITLANGTQKDYYAYRVGPFIASGTATYRIAA